MIFGAGPIPFLACFALGIGMGIIYKVLRLCARKLKLNKIFRNIIEFVFVILTAFLYFLVCFFTLEGTFRLFTLVGLCLGFVTSFALVKLVKAIIQRVFEKRKGNFHLKQKD